MSRDRQRRLVAVLGVFLCGLLPAAVAGAADGGGEPPPPLPPKGGGGPPPPPPPPPAPKVDAVDDAVTAREDEPLVIEIATLLANDSGNGIRIVSVGDGRSNQGASVTLSGTTITYRQNRPDFFGADRFVYTIADSAGARDNGFVAVTVEGVNDAPRAYAMGPFTIYEGTPYTGAFGLFAYDPDGDELTYSWSGGSGLDLTPAGPQVTALRDDGPFSTSVDVAVDDGHGTSASATIPVNVANVEPQVVTGVRPAYWGQRVALDVTVTDPSSADNAAGFTRSWRISKHGGSELELPGSTAAYTFAKAGFYQVFHYATDKDGATGEGHSDVIVGSRGALLTYYGLRRLPFGFAGFGARLEDGIDPATARLGGQSIEFIVWDTAYRSNQRFPATTNSYGIAVGTAGGALLPGEYRVAAATAMGDAYDVPDYFGASPDNALSVVNTEGRVSGEGTTAAGTVKLAVRSDGGTIGGTFVAGDLTAAELTAYGQVGREAWLAGRAGDGRSFVARLDDNGSRDDRVLVWIDGAATPVGGALTSGSIRVQ